MAKPAMITVMSTVGGILMVAAGWLLFKAVGMPHSDLPATDPTYGIAEFAILQTRVAIMTLSASVFVSGSAFIVGACIVSALQAKSDGGNGDI